MGTLIHEGRASDLINSGIKAMEKSCADFANGNDSIPDKHGEFFIAALTGALPLFSQIVSADMMMRWKSMLSTPIDKVWQGDRRGLNNWRTYAMKGEWMRAKTGLIPMQDAIEFIEKNWLHATQYERIALDKWNLYQDWSSDPQSLAVEAVGRGNLAALTMDGYDGPSALGMQDIVRRGSETALLLQSPTGQCPPNGRTDNHVFNDILYQLIFEVLAEDAWKRDQIELAGRYRRAALLSFLSIQRWKRADGPWAGSFYITKNQYDPGMRIGYQPASQWGNYSGAMMFHLAEAFHNRRTEIPELAAPSEIGGYAFRTDDRFSTYIANAGGMQVLVNLRGATVPKYDKYWTPLGAVRFSRMGWDDRMGPSDRARSMDQGLEVTYRRGVEATDKYRAQSGITFGPAWMENGTWTRVSDMAAHYRATVRTDFVHPLLVKFSVVYSYITGRGGPYFHHDFVVTPDGVLTTLTSPQGEPFALTIPLLAEDGTAMSIEISENRASVQHPATGDQQNFISLNEKVSIHREAQAIQSTYGKLIPVRFETQEKENTVFVYPKSVDDPAAQTIRESFKKTESGFESALCRIEGNLYYGRTSAGGLGQSLDLDHDGIPEVMFDEPCGFILRHTNNSIISVETDRRVKMSIGKRNWVLDAYSPLVLSTE